MPRLFISHSSVESILANQMASWIETAIPDVTCFCSSRPADLVPGTEWLKEIFEKSTSSDLCLLMLSPDSALNLGFILRLVYLLGPKSATRLYLSFMGALLRQQCLQQLDICRH